MELPRANARTLALLSMFVLPGCASQQAEWAALGKSGLLGLDQTDLRMCAGHPANITRIKGGEIWMYEQKAATPNGIPVPIPSLTGVGLIGGIDGYCRVQLRVIKGRVAEVLYAGATEVWGQRDAACGPIVRTCNELAARRR